MGSKWKWVVSAFTSRKCYSEIETCGTSSTAATVYFPVSCARAARGVQPGVRSSPAKTTDQQTQQQDSSSKFFHNPLSSSSPTAMAMTSRSRSNSSTHLAADKSPMAMRRQRRSRRSSKWSSAPAVTSPHTSTEIGMPTPSRVAMAGCGGRVVGGVCSFPPGCARPAPGLAWRRRWWLRNAHQGRLAAGSLAPHIPPNSSSPRRIAAGLRPPKGPGPAAAAGSRPSPTPLPQIPAQAPIS